MTIATISALKAYQNAVQTDKLVRQAPSAPNLAVKKTESFSSMVKNSIKQTNEMQEEKEAMIEAFAAGKSENVHELMITLQKAGLAMKLTSTVRNKVMEAYKELSHMAF